MVTDLNLTGMETGYKAFKASVIKSTQIEEDRSGFEPEITAKLTRMGCWIYDVGSARLAVGLMQKAKRSTGETA